MPATQAFISFNGGELTPYLRHRSDFDKQPSGAELMENFLPMPFGGVRKRPGTLWDAVLPGPMRLEAFQFSNAVSYILAWSATELRIYRADGTLASSLAGSFGDPFLLQFAQVNDVVFLTSRTVSPKRLSRLGDTTWTLEELPFSYHPFLDTNTVETATFTVAPTTAPAPWVSPRPGTYTVGEIRSNVSKIWRCLVAHNPSSVSQTEPGVGDNYGTYWREDFLTAGTTGQLTVSPAGPAFTPQHIGSLYEVSQRRDLDRFETYVKMTNSGGNGTILYSPQIIIKGQWSLVTTGLWYGRLYVQRSYTNGTTWEDLRSYTSTQDRNFTSSGDEDRRALYRLKYDPVDNSTGTAPRATLTSEEPYITSRIRIDSIPDAGDPRKVTFTAVDDVDFGTTDLWREAAFSSYQGYPAAVAIHERRLIFAGTVRHPVSVWTSETDNLLNFKPGGTEAVDPIFITLASTRQDPVRWIASQRRLIIGTGGAEWVFGSDTSDQPLSPESLLVRQYTNYGSAALPALTMHSGVFFIERQGRRLREMAYLLDQETYDAADLSRLAEHITESGLHQTAWQGNREPSLWAVRQDGTLVNFVYIRSERVAAWSRHTTRGGFFRSVAVLRTNENDDVVFVVVERDGAYHLEHFAAGQQRIQEEGNLAESYYLDSGTTGTPDGNRQLAVPPHLTGRELDVLADGYPMKLTAVDARITLPHDYTRVSAGLPVTSRLITLPPDTQTESGMSHGKIRRSNAIKLSLYRSYGGTILYRGQASDIATTTADTPADAPPPLATGWYETTLSGGYLQDLQFEIRHTTAHPFTLRAAAVEWAISEGQ